MNQAKLLKSVEKRIEKDPSLGVAATKPAFVASIPSPDLSGFARREIENRAALIAYTEKRELNRLFQIRKFLIQTDRFF